MKVICIDDKPRLGCHCEVKEGDQYTVVATFIGKWSGREYYGLAEFPDFIEGEKGFHADRFIPLSSIDETEMIREYNLTPEKLLAHQLSWYTERLKNEKRVEARSFLRGELFRLKNKIQ